MSRFDYWALTSLVVALFNIIPCRIPCQLFLAVLAMLMAFWGFIEIVAGAMRFSKNVGRYVANDEQYDKKDT